MYPLQINQSQEIKRCSLFHLHRVTTASGEQLLLKSSASGDDTSSILEREHSTLSLLTSGRVAKSIGLVHVRDRPGACYADFPGLPLSEARPRDPHGVRRLTLELCAILDDFHGAGLLLLGVSPSSFLCDASGRVQLIDAPFAQSSTQTFIRDVTDWIQSPFLPYAAPEAIRALSQPLDRAADLYCLGALLYELLGGRPPFSSQDPGELIQSHLARDPRPLDELAPDLPKSLARAVMQLLAKTPAQRPSTTQEFLQLCGFQSEPQSGKDASRDPFRPEPRDLLAFGARVYGREATLLELRSSIDEGTGRSVTFIHGEPGSGKTSLLEELRRTPALATSCWGKFLRGGASEPLSGWVALARALAAAALGSSRAEFNELRNRLEDALGPSAPVLVSLAGEWDAVLQCGPEPARPFEGGLNRTAVALQRLLGSYADPATPIWVFLDDLQWADPSSLRILELILTLPEAPNLRVLASIRSAEPGEPRDWFEALAGELKRGGVDVNEHQLGGLEPSDLRAFVRDSLGASVDRFDDLLRFVMDKTRGNPFFVRELLSALVRERALVRDDRGFHWNPASARIQLPDSLLDLLIRNIHSLPIETKALLTAAACFGEGVRRSDLCVALSVTPTAADEQLRSAVAAGLLHQHGAGAREPDPTYSFAHDRILEASLALTTEAERAALSIRFFRLLTADPSSDRVLTFTRANLFNAGSAEVGSAAERSAGIQANQTAGSAAKARGAYSQSLHYLTRALELLRQAHGDAQWHEQPELTRSVYEQTAEAALLCNRFELTAELCDALLAHSSDPLDRVTAHELRIRVLTAQKRFGEAVELALAAQTELKIRFPRNPKMVHVIWGYIRTLRRVKALGADRLLRLPVREDAQIAAASRLMQTVFAIAHFHKPELFPLFVYRQVEQCVAHGNDAYAGQAYSAFSMIMAGLGEFDLAHKVGQMSLDLQRSDPSRYKVRCRSLFSFYSFVAPWVHPVRDSFPELAAAAQGSLAQGDFEFVSYSVTMRALGRLYTGSSLAELSAEFDRNVSQLAALGQQRGVLIQRLMCEAVHELRQGAPEGPLHGPFYRRVEGLAQCKDPMDQTLVYHHHLAELCVAAHFSNVDAAVSAATGARPYLANGAFGSWLEAPFLFYEAWALGMSARSPAMPRSKAARRLAASEKRLKAWSKSSSVNFGSKLHFVQAERMRLSGRFEEASRGYESAIDESRAQGFYHEAALVHERAASLYQERGFPRLTGQHLREAHGLYLRWGAQAVADRLANHHPEHLALFRARSDGADALSHAVERLDYHALIKASQAISSETLQPRLLERLLRTIMEHTAAQRGVLLLDRRGELVVASEADVDRATGISDETVETVETTERVSRSIVRYVARVEKTVVLSEATDDATFGRDPYVKTRRPRSVLCTPISYQGKLLGVIYLENNRVGHVFTRARLEMVDLLASQAAISIANARYHALQLEAQQAKISPHFLFNALSSIAELATVDGAKAEIAIVKLAHLYRYILASSPAELVSLDRELSIVSDYLSLEKLRFGSKLDFSVTQDGPLEKVRIPGLLIQPLVENSIRHAIAHKLSEGHVWVSARVHGERCTIVVQDDGDGSKHPSTGTGFGLRSVQQRLELVYGTRFSFAITQRGGYRVELEVPNEAGATS
jgi:predicted ATPase/GAF domain-containing protein